MATKTHGFSLIELLITLVVVSLVMAGVISFFSVQARATLQEELSATLQANLRLASDKVNTSLRSTGYGVPTANLAKWVPWVSHFTSNPLAVQGSGSSPDTLSVAACTPEPVATLTANAAMGVATITLAKAVSGKDWPELLDNNTRRLIRIGDSESAHVIQITVDPANASRQIATIDTDPVGTGSQGLVRFHWAGTPVCRVDVVTYSVDTTTRELKINQNTGGGAQPALDGITDLQVTITAQEYQISLSGRSDRKDPSTRQYLARSLNSKVGRRN